MSARRFGQTWWSRRWIQALEDLGAAYTTRLPRGRTYARQGRVTLQTVEAGRIVGAVQGSRVAPYVVELRLPAFDDGTWQSIVAALAGRVRHAAALLEGRMPEDIDEVLGDRGVSLFPGPGELLTRCTCPDFANPCKHVAAVHYVLAATFDEDPFLLPALRGRDRDALLAALRSARAGAGAGAEDGAVSGGPVGGPEDPEDVDDDPGVDWDGIEARTLATARGALDTIELHPATPDDPTAVLRRTPAAAARRRRAPSRRGRDRRRGPRLGPADGARLTRRRYRRAVPLRGPTVQTHRKHPGGAGQSAQLGDDEADDHRHHDHQQRERPPLLEASPATP